MIFISNPPHPCGTHRLLNSVVTSFWRLPKFPGASTRLPVKYSQSTANLGSSADEPFPLTSARISVLIRGSAIAGLKCTTECSPIRMIFPCAVPLCFVSLPIPDFHIQQISLMIHPTPHYPFLPISAYTSAESAPELILAIPRKIAYCGVL